jgi:hypothetical protein
MAISYVPGTGWQIYINDLQRQEDLAAINAQPSNQAANVLSSAIPAPLPDAPYYNVEQYLLHAIAFGGQAVGNQTISVTSGATATLTPPANAKIALIEAEVDSTDTNQTAAIRFWQDGSSPDSTHGQTLGQLGVVYIKTIRNISNAKFIGVTSGKTHKLQVQYFA